MKKIVLGLALTLFIAAFVPYYWATEPARQEAAAARQTHEAAERGAVLFLHNCAVCHGSQGEGAVGPALKNTALDEKVLRRVISRGVPGTPMPAFGDEDGGPLKHHEISDVIILLQNWDDSLVGGGPPPAATTSTPTQPSTPAEPATPVPAKEDSPAAPQVSSPTPVPTDEDPQAGRQVFITFCGACHAIQGVAGAAGAVGPDLTKVAAVAGERVVGMSAKDYLREKVRDPEIFRVPDYPPIMQSGMVPEGPDEDDLMAFLLTLR